MTVRVCECCGQPILSDLERTLWTLPWSPTERRILERLLRSYDQDVGAAALIEAVYHDDVDGGPLDARKTITVFVHNIRKKLAPAGLTISCRSGVRTRRLTEARPVKPARPS